MRINKAAFLFLFLLSSVRGDILDDYLRTDGVWILTRNKQFYTTNNEKECAEKCEAERNFNCRAFLFTRKKLQCLTLAENAQMTVTFNSTDAVLYEKKNIPWLKTTVATLGRLGITMAFEIVYLVNTELYPTTLRNFGVSLCSSLCDLGGIIAPFLLFRLADIWLELPLIIFSILAVVCGLLVLLLPETKGISLPETVEDVEQLSSHFGKCGKKWKHQDTNSCI